MNCRDYVVRRCEIVNFTENDGEVHPIFGPEE